MTDALNARSKGQPPIMAPTIVSYTRNEATDGTACDICTEMNEKTIGPDDPYLDLDFIHSGCNGTWVPNYSDEEDLPDITGIPASIDDRFDKVNGRPVIDKFSKKPTPESRTDKK